MKKNLIIIIIIILVIAILSIGFIKIILPNYTEEEKLRDISVIINNSNVTNRLKADVYINENGAVYLSINDIKNFFDKYIYYDKELNQVITTYDTKTAILSLENDNAMVNGKEYKIKDKLMKLETTLGTKNENSKTEEVIYLPISDLYTIYNIELTNIDNKIITIDSLDRTQKKRSSPKVTSC